MLRLRLIGSLAALVLLTAVACGGDDEGSTPTERPQQTSEATAEPGSEDRSVRGFEGIVDLDDSVALWDSRPADEDRTGVTDDSVRICRPVSMTGAAAAYTEANALIEEVSNRVNEAGGIHGRQLDLVLRDDASNPAQAAQVVKELVENDKCFIIFAHPGSATSGAAFDYLAEMKVPDFMFGTGAPWATEKGVSTAFPGLMSYPLMGKIIGDIIFDEDPAAKVAVIYQNDDYGTFMRNGLRASAEERGVELATEISFDIGAPDLTSQTQQAVNSGATALFLVTYPGDCPKVLRALREGLGSEIPVWDPQGNCVVGPGAELPGNLQENLYAIDSNAFVATEDNPAVKAVNKILDEQDLKPNNYALDYAMLYVEHLIRTLELAGPDLTREGFVEAAVTGFDGTWQCSVCLGPTVWTDADHWANEAGRPTRYVPTTKSWQPVGDIFSLETSEGKGMRGNVEGFPCSEQTPCPWND